MDTSFHTNHSSSSSNNNAAVEIPVWIRSSEPPKWVSGIDRDTTCEDVLISVLKQQGGGSSVERRVYKVRDPADYTLVEQWRGVERPLSRSSKIQKLWLAWGEEREAVRFVVKRLRSSTSGMTSTSSRTRNRVRRRNSNSSTNSRASDTPHPSKRLQVGRRAAKADLDPTDIQSMMKEILSQGQMIYQELHKLGASQVGSNGLPLPSGGFSTQDLSSTPWYNQASPASTLNRNGSFLRKANRSQSESNLLSTLRTAEQEAINSSTSRLPQTEDLDAIQSAEVYSELNRTSELIDELCRLSSLNEELHNAETKMYLLSSNYQQLRETNIASERQPMVAMSQELADLQESNRQVSAAILKNQSLLSNMDAAFKSKKEAVKRLEYDFNLIEKEGKKLAREFDKVMQISIPDANAEGDDANHEVIYYELKEIRQNSVTKEVVGEPKTVVQSAGNSPSGESGGEQASSGVSSGSDTGNEDNKVSKVLVVSDYSAVKSVVKLKEAKKDEKDGGVEEGTGSDTGLSSLHSSGEDDDNSHNDLSRTANLADIISAASGDFGTLV